MLRIFQFSLHRMHHLAKPHAFSREGSAFIYIYIYIYILILIDFMYKISRKIIFTGGKGSICSIVFLIIFLDCQKATYNHGITK